MTAEPQLSKAIDAKRSPSTNLLKEIDGHGRYAYRLTDTFDVLAEATDGLTKVRRLIVLLGVSGRLPAQMPDSLDNHRTASRWEQKPLAECVDILDAARVPVNETERRARIAGKDEKTLFPYFGATRQQGWIDSFLFDEELVLLGEDGVPFLDPDRPKAYVVRGKTWVNNHAHVLRPRGLDATFLCHVLNVTDYTDRISGTTRAKLTKGKMVTIPIPLPPLAVQKSIVAKVDQLLALCDELEAQQGKKLQTGTQLTKSALEALTSAEGPDEFGAAWKRVMDNFDVLTDRVDKVEKLRSSILMLAIRGRLTRPERADGDAAEQLRQAGPIPKRRHDRGKVGAGHQALYSIRPNWSWCSLDQLVNPKCPISYGVLVPGPDVNDGVPFVRIQDLSMNASPALPAKRIARAVADQYSRTTLQGGELLLAVVGATIGKVGLAPKTWAGASIARAVCRIMPNSAIDVHYLGWLLQSDMFQEYFRGTTRTLAQPTLNVGMICAAPVPLPPKEEQLRIVAVLERLMAACDDLESRLRQAESQASKLVESVVQELVA